MYMCVCVCVSLNDIQPNGTLVIDPYQNKQKATWMTLSITTQSIQCCNAEFVCVYILTQNQSY